MRLNILAAALVAIVAVSPAFADGPEFQLRNLYQACLEGKCMQKARGIVRELQRETDNADRLNAQYGYVALAAFQAARRADSRRNMVQVAAVLRGLSRLSSHEEQSRAFGNVSRAILRGNHEIFQQENPFSASPVGTNQSDRRRLAVERRAEIVRALKKRREAVLKRLRNRSRRG